MDAVNLFGEAEPYGPKDRERLHAETRYLRSSNKLAAGGLMSTHQRTEPDHPAGAPPLDWWIIEEDI